MPKALCPPPCLPQRPRQTAELWDSVYVGGSTPWRGGAPRSQVPLRHVCPALPTGPVILPHSSWNPSLLCPFPTASLQAPCPGTSRGRLGRVWEKPWPVSSQPDKACGGWGVHGHTFYPKCGGGMVRMRTGHSSGEPLWASTSPSERSPVNRMSAKYTGHTVT